MLLRRPATLAARSPPRRCFARKVPRKGHGGTKKDRKSSARSAVENASVIRGKHELREETLRQLLASKPHSLTLWLDSVQDPHNLGACLRSADGAGCCAVIIPSRGAVGLTDTVHAVACGAALAVPLIQVGSMAAVMKRCQEDFGLHFVGTSDRATKTLYETDLSSHRHLALVYAIRAPCPALPSPD